MNITTTLDENDFVTASVITKEGKSATFYVNPFTGEKLGEPEKKHPVFQFATSLHRSLFLKSTGRFIVGPPSSTISKSTNFFLRIISSFFRFSSFLLLNNNNNNNNPINIHSHSM